MGKLVELGQGTRAVTAARFATNAKTTGLTTSFFVKAGMTLSAAGLAVGIIGSYPFAGFIKEEAVQQTGLAFFVAEKNKDIEGMEAAIAGTEEILFAAPSIIDSVPFVNVLKSLKGYFEAVELNLGVQKRTLAKR